MSGFHCKTEHRRRTESAKLLIDNSQIKVSIARIERLINILSHKEVYTYLIKGFCFLKSHITGEKTQMSRSRIRVDRKELQIEKGGSKISPVVPLYEVDANIC